MIVFNLDQADNRTLNERLAEQLKEDMDFASESGLTTSQVYYHRFPEWVWLQQPARCMRIIEELQLMTRDSFRHRPTPLYEYVLYACIEEWANDLEDVLAEGVPADEVEQTAADHDYWSEAAEVFDRAFQQVDMMANAVLERSAQRPTADEIQPYLELMPNHVRNAVLTALYDR